VAEGTQASPLRVVEATRVKPVRRARIVGQQPAASELRAIVAIVLMLAVTAIAGLALAPSGDAPVSPPTAAAAR
jgi:hypothetical protein